MNKKIRFNLIKLSDSQKKKIKFASFTEKILFYIMEIIFLHSTAKRVK